MTDQETRATEGTAPEQPTDATLSRELTRLLRGVPGVVDVFDAHPVVEAAVKVVAAELDLREAPGLVDVDRSEGLLSVAAHVATDLAQPTPETLARAAAALREHVAGRAVAGPGGGPGDPDGAPSEVVVSVTARLVEERRESAAPAE